VAYSPSGTNALQLVTVTARTPHQPGGGDVSQTLADLERKLRDLEEALATSTPGAAPSASPPPPPPPAYAPPPPPPAPPPPRPDADRLIADARARLGGLNEQVDELLRFREQLHRTARELEAEYARVLARIAAPGATATATAPPPPVQTPPPVQAPPPLQAQQPPVQAPPPVPPPAAAPPTAPVAHPAPAAGAHEDTVFEGTVVIDAGPFADIATLGAFEQALARVPGAEDVYVSGFEGNRALVELRLAAPTAVVRALRATLPTAFTVAGADANRLTLDVRPDPAGS